MINNVTSYIQTGSQGIDGMTDVLQKETSQITKVYTDAKDLLQKLTDSEKKQKLGMGKK